MSAAGGGIFISYRRSDSQFAAGRLADALVREFGDERIFRDIEDIAPGADFVETLDRALEGCRVMLVLIGPNWLSARDAEGHRRIDGPGDWVRQEIARALRRGVRVIPVLLERTEMPAEAQLPQELQALARRQALQLADAHWARDVAALIELVGPGRAASAAPPPAADVASRLGAGVRKGLTWATRLLLGVGVVILVLVVLTVRACVSETPELAGPFSSAEGWTMVFEPQAREGQRAWHVAGRTPTGRLDCTGVPGMFGSLDLDCTVQASGAAVERFQCSGLYVSEGPLEISGDCNWPHDGSTRKLKLRR